MTAKLILRDLIKTKENKNEEVLKFNDVKIKDTDNTFSETYGALCGNGEGVLLEESLIMLFDNSAIVIERTANDKISLLQNSKLYIADLKSMNDSEYVDFNTINH